MVLIVKSGRAEINETDLTVKKDTPLAGITGVHTRGGGNGAIIGERLVGIVDEKDVLGFQIGVNKIQVVKD